MHQRVRHFSAVVLLLATLGASVVADVANAQGSAAGPPIVVGVPIPLSGDLRSFGIMMKNSFEMAKESINESGGINGRPLQVIYGDDQGRPAEGVKVVTEMVSRSKAVMLVGGYSSSVTHATARAAQKLDIPFLICTASADKITEESLDNVYRLNPPISEYTQGLEDFWIKNLRLQSMAIVYEDTLFGTNGMKRMIEFCHDNAIEVRQIISYDRTRASKVYFRPLVALLTEDPPDVVYMVSYLKDAVALVQTLRDLGVKSLLCGGGGGFTHHDFIQGAGRDANLVLTATLWFWNSPRPGAKDYYDGYFKRYGQTPDYHGAEAFSALTVAADALRRAGALTAEGIRTALNKTFLTTPFGPVKFYSYYDFERQNSVPTLVLQVIDGQFECIWPPGQATAGFVQPSK